MNETTGYNGPGESLIPDPKAGIERASAGFSEAFDSSASIGSRSFGAFEGVAYSLDTAVGLIPGEGAAEHAIEKGVATEIEHVAEGEATHAAETTVTKDAKSVATDTGAAGGSAPKVTKPDEKTYQTYTKTNEETGEVYTGRTSGTGTPAENVAARDKNHHMNDKGFGPAKLDKSSTNKDAIRGREQQKIDQNGGAKSDGGTSGNSIRGVRKDNPKAEQYKQAATKEFGSS
ncbi:MAG: hypothetical protein LV479_12210 [Methylacidiphilales bacterium]|nr:hypothetical protein [Candidatus Methylacidiphilales bacterium]